MEVCETFTPATLGVNQGNTNGLVIYCRFDRNNLPLNIDDCRKQQGKLFESVLNFFTIELFNWIIEYKKETFQSMLYLNII